MPALCEATLEGNANGPLMRENSPDEGPAASCPLLSVVFITYRRLGLLRQTSAAFAAAIRYPRMERIVADDGSPAKVQDGIRRLDFDKYVLSRDNKGLGANNNNALLAASGDYILMMQDDWLPTELADGAVARAMAILRHDPQVGMIRFYPGAIDYYPLETRRLEGSNYYVCDHGAPSYDKRQHVYSDTPHLRRAALNAPDVLGLYLEGAPMEDTEEEYSNRLEAQSRYRVGFLDRGSVVYFRHIGEDHSHRTTKLRYRLDGWLLSAAAMLGLRKESWLFQRLRSVWYGIRGGLIALGLLR